MASFTVSGQVPRLMYQLPPSLRSAVLRSTRPQRSNRVLSYPSPQSASRTQLREFRTSKPLKKKHAPNLKTTTSATKQAVPPSNAPTKTPPKTKPTAQPASSRPPNSTSRTATPSNSYAPPSKSYSPPPKEYAPSPSSHAGIISALLASPTPTTLFTSPPSISRPYLIAARLTSTLALLCAGGLGSQFVSFAHENLSFYTRPMFAVATLGAFVMAMPGLYATHHLLKRLSVFSKEVAGGRKELFVKLEAHRTIWSPLRGRTVTVPLTAVNLRALPSAGENIAWQTWGARYEAAVQDKLARDKRQTVFLRPFLKIGRAFGSAFFEVKCAFYKENTMVFTTKTQGVWQMDVRGKFEDVRGVGGAKAIQQLFGI
ncbi:hypothetical protein K402DRAFT_459169 [Aulographum hederae CBS 113979]|uniref:Uncharacterized protein n=1 Tax=Aulographum hederae CBS 113979 TaxID=1176131 RepID=A0A6G1HG03_9PEZI|nr:hypothetical protein K402DRAFT_459169 [Aulographum hederae CBS 113979]